MRTASSVKDTRPRESFVYGASNSSTIEVFGGPMARETLVSLRAAIYGVGMTGAIAHPLFEKNR